MRFFSAHFKGGRIVPREVTEEEKKEKDAGAGGAKKAPPAKGAKPTEVDPAEAEALLKAIAEKEADNAELKVKWEDCSFNEQFFSFVENPFREPSVRFITPPVEVRPGSKTEGEEAPEPTPPNQVEIELSQEELMKLESETVENKGCWVFFEKIIPKDEVSDAPAAAAGKKAPPPKKPAAGGAPSTDEKPSYSRAWLDLSPFLHPGATCIEQRIFLNQIQAIDAGISEKPDTAGAGSIVASQKDVEKTEGDMASIANEDMFETAQTYISLNVTLSEPLMPETDFKHIKKDGSGLIQKFQPLKKYPTTQDAIRTFEAAVDFIVGEVGQEYAKTTQETDQE